MQTADFLYPIDLKVTETTFKKVLFIGSCFSEVYTGLLKQKSPATHVDHILFNNVSDLPAKSDEEIREYDFQYIQISLRSLLGDGIVRLADADKLGTDWVSHGCAMLDMMFEKAAEYNHRCGLMTMVSNFIVPQGMTGVSLTAVNENDDIGYVVRELNRYLALKVKELKNAYLADVDGIANSIGKRHFSDDVIFFYTHGAVVYPDWVGHERFPSWTSPDPGRIDPLPDFNDFYPNKTPEFFDAVFRQMEAIYRTVNQVDVVKLVVFDLDNTLWRGQLVEHYQPGSQWPYPDGWPLGIWEAIQHLRRRGVMVSIVSKNDHDYVRDNWEKAAPFGFVKFEDFLTPKINWAPKVENIRELMGQLSLTAKSVVFVDDNPVERESVASQIDGIRVMGSNPFLTRRILLWSPETQVPTITEESSRREEMLKAQVDRETTKSTMSREEFLKSLSTELEIWPVTGESHPSFNRVFELVNKTNQFNTTGRRWTHEDYSAFYSEGGKVFAFRVKDRFTDYGTVGVLFVKDRTIIQFVMSCRVLGMEIETSALSFAVSSIRQNSPEAPVLAMFNETESNTPCRSLYPNFGFVRASDGSYALKAPNQHSSRVKLNLLEMA